ncbi:sugar transferase [Cohnella luojiensis]|uniref:Sugar transferase n=1 Tax=Cohnella luojiensis TaxID=652876 RepID=A0A4Y8LQ21_9BACL|nr:sugar transferase [Cohnella luojiensis]TFE22636.1 sugar transferase [Cohnella luojiensis]
MPHYTNDLEVIESSLYNTNKLILHKTSDQRMYIIVKRIVDILISAGGILLYLPVFIVIAILIKLEDTKGTIFFKQVRVGKNGKPFNIYKIRSMVPNAEELLPELAEKNEVKGAMFKIKDDPRVTRLGKFIRKTSIDEFPQLWNVLKGDMSLVGPRPSLPREVEQYSLYDSQRLVVTPGCTGLWQVSGRNELHFKDMVELDLYYIQRRNLFFDIKLILKTFRVILFPKDTY